jgi:hypothetical protein
LEELSRKEKWQVEKANILRIIISVINFTLGKKISWKKIGCDQAHSDFYRGNVTILGVPVKIECAQWSALRHLNIYCEEEVWSTLCPRKYKSNFKHMLSVIKESIAQDILKKAEEDTTVILPNPPDQKVTKSTNNDNLREVIDFLTAS